MSLNVQKKNELQAIVSHLKLGKQLGAGGNAIVYAAKRDGGEPVAIKFLLNSDTKRYYRFRDEVLVVTTTLKGSSRVIPIIEHKLPEVAGMEVPWYIMPVATPIRRHLKYASKKELVTALAELADGLTDLHDKKVAHRDIKPENLFYFENTFRYGDFGLAKFPESVGLTTASEPIGPVGYMADEMIRDSDTADPFKADMFSLAKTLWVLLTKQPHPFLGPYSRLGRYSLDELLPKDNFVHEPLDDLLESCTHTIPDRRPTPREFAQTLRGLLDAQNDFRLGNPLQWSGAESRAFSVPCTRMEWTATSAIVEVIKLLSRRESLNHSFFPEGGGLDITDAELTEGGSSILLWHGKTTGTVIKPVRLTLERMGAGPQGSYATLESAALEPFDVYEKGEWYEELLRCDEYNYMALPRNDEPYPKEVDRVSRYFKPGMFIIAPKGGIYNRIDTYEGNGNALGRDNLRTVFERALKEVNKGQPTFGLQKCVRLVKQPISANTTFLVNLDLHTFEHLLALDEAMKALKVNDRETMFKNFSQPDPAWDAKNKEIVKFLERMNDEQYGEAMALMLFGRNSIQDAADIQRISTQYAAESRNAPYLAEKFGNSYFIKAATRFGMTIVHTQNGI